MAGISVGLDGLTPGEDSAFASKRTYVKRRILKMGVDKLFVVADKIITNYGDTHLELTLQTLRGGQTSPIEQLILVSIGGIKPDIIVDQKKVAGDPFSFSLKSNSKKRHRLGADALRKIIQHHIDKAVCLNNVRHYLE